MKTSIATVTFVLAAFVVSGCNSSKATKLIGGATVSPTASAEARGASPPGQTAAIISATPNPVPAGSGNGTTTIKWTTGDGSVGQVYVSKNHGEETLFGEGADGSNEANWIESGSSYEFRLYAGNDHAKLLAKTLVTRAK